MHIKGQFQQKLSSPQAFVSSRFQEKLQSEPAKETKGTTQPAKVEDMSQPVQSTKIEAVMNKPGASIHKVEEVSKPEEKPEMKKVNEVQVAQKSLNDVFRKRKMRLLIRGN